MFQVMVKLHMVLFIICILYNEPTVSYKAIRKGPQLLAGPDERQSCPAVNCIGKTSCTSNTQCTLPQKCCIDLANSLACCTNTAAPAPVAPTVAPTIAPTVAPTIAPTIAPTAAPTAAPTIAPTAAPTAAPTNAPTSAAAPASTAAAGIGTCSGLTPACTDLTLCICKKPEDCFTEETCCIDTTGPGPSYTPYCYYNIPLTTVVTRAPGQPCPSSVLSSPCLPPQAPAGTTAAGTTAAGTTAAGATAAGATAATGATAAATTPAGSPTLYCDSPGGPSCSAGQICCKKERNASGCCIKYP